MADRRIDDYDESVFYEYILSCMRRLTKQKSTTSSEGSSIRGMHSAIDFSFVS